MESIASQQVQHSCQLVQREKSETNVFENLNVKSSELINEGIEQDTEAFKLNEDDCRTIDNFSKWQQVHSTMDALTWQQVQHIDKEVQTDMTVPVDK